MHRLCIVSQLSFCWVPEYEYILQLFSDQTQLEALREDYSKLERDYITSRQKSKEKITDYMSNEAGVKFAELQNQLKKLRADISLKHPVSVRSASVKFGVNYVEHNRKRWDIVNSAIPIRSKYHYFCQ